MGRNPWTRANPWAKPTRPAPKGPSTNTAASPTTKLVETVMCPRIRVVSEAHSQNTAKNASSDGHDNDVVAVASNPAMAASTTTPTNARVRIGVGSTGQHSGRGSADGEIGTGRRGVPASRSRANGSAPGPTSAGRNDVLDNRGKLLHNGFRPPTDQSHKH